MEMKHWKKVLAMILCLVTVMTNSSLTALASETGAVAAGSFVLTASTKDTSIIEPERIVYEKGDTIRDALIKSEHHFQGIDSEEFITAVDGVDGSYSIFTNDQNYDLNQAADTITTLEFTELLQEEIDFTKRAELLILMESYRQMDEEVKNYVPAAKAYQTALNGLRNANEDTQVLFDRLDQAIKDYDRVMNGNDITVTVQALQGTSVLKNAHITFIDENGYRRETVGTKIQLGKTGTYQFIVSDGGYNRAEGTIEITKTDQSFEVQIPEGEWFGDIKVTRPDFTDETHTSRVPYTGTQDAGTHTAEYWIEDCYGYKRGLEGELLYLYAEQGVDLPDASSTTLRTVYTGLDGEDESQELTSWESIHAQLYAALDYGMEGRTFSLEAWYDTETKGQPYRMIQSYTVTLTRIPTCLDLFLTDEKGTSLLGGFSGTTYEYDITTDSEILHVEPVLYGSEGYTSSIQLNGKTVNGSQMTLKKGLNEVTVTVSHNNGSDNTYRFHVILSDSGLVTMELKNSNYTVEVFNSNDSKITPVNGTSYALIPGETYYYIATKETYYHTMAEFTAVSGQKIAVAEPNAESAITAIALYNTGSITQRTEILPKTTFSETDFLYEYYASDALNGVAYLQASSADPYTIKATYQGVPDKNGKRTSYEKKISAAVDASAKAETLTKVYAPGAEGNVITLRAEKQGDSCIYYQDVTLKLNRQLSLNSLTIEGDAGECLLFDEDSNLIAFDRDRETYFLYVPYETASLKLRGEFYGNADSGYYALIDGEKYTELSEIICSLENAGEQKNLTMQICNDNTEAKSRTYTLHIERKEQIRVSFNLMPKTALVYMTDQIDGSRVYPDEKGIFALMPGFRYTYTVTAYGYVGKTVTDFQPDASAESKRVTVVLKEAEKNLSLEELTSAWPTFRDQNNNSILNEKLPIRAEDAVLYWARGNDSNKFDDITDGFDGYCGHPILVDDAVYTYDNTRIFRLNTVTGAIEAVSEDTLVTKSSFAIQGMTYAEGMLFVGLSNGSIQAFNAATLESLWVYEDVLGGQPNSQITYKDGYIYTGFWNSEVKYANYVCISVTDEDPADHYEQKAASWVYGRKGGFYWAGAYVTDDFLLIGTDDGEAGYRTGYAHLVSLDPKTGIVIDDLTMPHTGDIRSSITYDIDETGDYYFTSKGGYFYRVSVDEKGQIQKDSLKWVTLENGTDTQSMSTSTPTIYHGRAYVGVSGSGQFTAYSGHNISVIDLKKMEIAYQVPTQGYPQTSGILTTAYGGENDQVYVYFFDNYTPGKLRVFSDRPGQTELKETTKETFQTAQGEKSCDTGYVLFTPADAQAEYAICSPVVDEYGTMYFRNDSNYMMAIGSVIDQIEVTELPKKTVYRIGEVFDPTGMKVMATYKNGCTRDITAYVTYSEEPLSADDTEFAITFEHVMYQNQNDTAGVAYTAPMTMITLKVDEKGEENEPGVVRISGSGRYETAYKAADTYKEILGTDKFEAVIVATGKNFADALSGSYLASVKQAPILLTSGKEENIAQLHTYIRENVAENGTIYILGGTGAVPSGVDTIQTEGYRVVRISGASRYETSLKILAEAGMSGNEIVVATGKNFADSLSASASGRPIMLVKPGEALRTEQKSVLENVADGTFFVIGGTGAVSESIENELAAYGKVVRVAGKNRYDTSVKVAETFFDDVTAAVIASGKNFPDGLCGGPLAAALNAPLILTKDGDLTAADYVRAHEITSGYVLGGAGALAEETVNTIFGITE